MFDMLDVGLLAQAQEQIRTFRSQGILSITPEHIQVDGEAMFDVAPASAWTVKGRSDGGCFHLFYDHRPTGIRFVTVIGKGELAYKVLRDRLEEVEAE